MDHDQKKNLYRVIVGTHGVRVANQIEKLDGNIREASRDIDTKKEVASRRLPNEVILDTYLGWQPVEDIENEIQKKIAEITSSQRVLEWSTEIKAKGKLSKIELPAFPSDFATILLKQLTDITADAEVRVRQQITNQNMGNQGEMWLSQGLNYVSNGKCPFCGQGLNTNDLLAAYRSHFNAAYKSLKQEVAQLTQRITMPIAELTLNTTQQTLSNNLTLIDFWKQFAQVSVPDLSMDDARKKYATLRDIALALAQKKQQTLMESVEPEENFQFVLEAITLLQQFCQIYNAAVDTCNSLITDQHKIVGQGCDINTLKKELADLEFRKKRFEEEMLQSCQAYQAALSAKTILEKQKAEVEEELDRYCQQILRSYEQAINVYLDQFNAGFQITNSRHSYTGGTPSSHYQIQINNTAIGLGDSRTGSGTPCFKTTLSSGNRSALALAFFFAPLKKDAELADKIIVLDYPFTSLDRFRRTFTQQLISQFSGMAKQALVLSHDPHFFKLIWEDTSDDIKVLQLCPAGNNTVIGEWDIET